MSTELHRVTWTLGPEQVQGTFHCDGTRLSPCHLTRVATCTHEGACECALVPSNECWATPWFTAGDSLQSFYDGPANVALRDGPVVISYSTDLEGAAWSYAPQPADPFSGLMVLSRKRTQR
jgi:hypothetical protein